MVSACFPLRRLSVCLSPRVGNRMHANPRGEGGREGGREEGRRRKGARNGNEARARIFPQKTFQFIEGRRKEEWKGREGGTEGGREGESQGRVRSRADEPTDEPNAPATA